MSATQDRVVIRPQPGPQTIFLQTLADVAIYGGSAGGGKSFALLLEALRHIHNREFGAVIFRRTSPQIRNEGGLWDESAKLYPLVGGEPRPSTLEWRFPSGSKIKFGHLQYEEDKHDWQGAQVPYLGFDELTHFTEGQFFYMLSRNRSTCGVRPYVRATTNPDVHSWVKPFLAPWLDRDQPEPAESGEIRWFVRDAGQIMWVDEGTEDAKSCTFIRASVYDNQILLQKNPEYLANLKALPLVDRKRLLDGDWDFAEEGNMFRRHWFPIVRTAPAALRVVRYWDLAATQERAGRDPDWTAGALLGRASDNRYYLLDVQRLRETPATVEALVKQTAAADRARFGGVQIVMEQEPGASGLVTIDHYRRNVLNGYHFTGNRCSGDKTERARPVSSQAEGGNILLVEGAWNHAFLNEVVSFPTDGVHDDQVDALSGAFSTLAGPVAGAPAVGGERTLATRYAQEVGRYAGGR